MTPCSVDDCGWTGVLRRGGLTGNDADTAIDHYVRGMPLTALDLAVLNSETAAQQASTLTSWYGSDGCRVAAIVLASNR